MSNWDEWTDSPAEIKKWLTDARERRLVRGRNENDTLRQRVLASEAGGHGMRTEIESRALHKKSISFTRTQRRREDAERDLDLKKVGAAVRRAQRDLERVKKSRTSPLFEFEPSNKPKSRLRREKDLYFEWICRGLKSGSSKAFEKSTKPRSLARQAKWCEHEFQDKIAYIERADALEEVPGNIVSNMGADQAERIGCASLIEDLEHLNRSNSNVYVHSILALPHELSPEGRAAVLHEICDLYGRLGLPHCAALHKPDPKNSQKNFHAHILVSLRPMERAGDRLLFSPRKLTWLNTTGGLALQRRIIAGAFNRALKAERSNAAYTHKSRLADGLAPGGFTKWAGVSFAPAHNGALGNFVAAEAELEETELLQSVAETYVEVAELLERAEVGLADLSVQVSSHQQPVRQPAPTNVANSQPAAADDGCERKISREVTEEKAKLASEQETKPVPMVTPQPSLEDIFGPALRKVRKKWNGRNSDIVLEDGPASFAVILDCLESGYRDGTLVLTKHGSDLDASYASSAIEGLVKAVANSQQGFDLLEDVAAEMELRLSKHLGPVETLQSPAVTLQQQLAYLGVVKKPRGRG